MFKQIGIIGAGTLGREIAKACIIANFKVLIYDINDAVLRRAKELIKSNLKKDAKKISHNESLIVMNRLQTRTSLLDLGNCDLIIETVTDDLKVKSDIFKHLDSSTKSTAILATSTSSLSITSIASSIRNPERVVGLHFFIPIEAYEIVEVVAGYKTNKDIIPQVKSFVEHLKKTPILVKDRPGHIVYRLSQVFLGEALRLTEDNIANFDQIDKIVKMTGGFKCGPFEILDTMGIDKFFDTSKLMYERTFFESKFKPSQIIGQMMEAGNIGKKSGKGFYNYNESEQILGTK